MSEKEDIFLEIGTKHVAISVNILVKKALQKCSKQEYVKIQSGKVLICKEFFLKRVPNVYRFSVKKCRGRLTLYYFTETLDELKSSSYNDRFINLESNLPSIVIILESPHDKEYNYADGMLIPIAPAQGDTGEYIHDEIIDVLYLIEDKEVIFNNNQEYRLIIVNPVPCQTSLHFIHRQPIKSSYKTLRDKVWTTLWEHDIDIKEDFKKTLVKLNPYVIINACTADLKGAINNLVLGLFEKTPLFSINHPSSWWQGHNLKRTN